MVEPLHPKGVAWKDVSFRDQMCQWHTQKIWAQFSFTFRNRLSFFQWFWRPTLLQCGAAFVYVREMQQQLQMDFLCCVFSAFFESLNGRCQSHFVSISLFLFTEHLRANLQITHLKDGSSTGPKVGNGTIENTSIMRAIRRGMNANANDASLVPWTIPKRLLILSRKLTKSHELSFQPHLHCLMDSTGLATWSIVNG